jgi:hypothetical protein
MKSASLQSLVCGRLCRHIWLPASSSSPCFQGTARTDSAAVPHSFQSGFILSWAFASSSEFSGPYPPVPSRNRAPFLGVSSPFATSAVGVHLRGLPRPLRSALRVSHPLDGFLRHQLCGSISPRCHVRGSPFRGFPSSAAMLPRRLHLPSCRLTVSPATRLRRSRQRHGPVFRASFRAGVRCASQGISLRHTRSPLGLRLLRVLRSPAGLPAFAGGFALGLRPGTVLARSPG